MSDPQRADDYDDRGARAANNVLVELGQVLGTYREAFVIIGGLVPGLHIPGRGHVGSLDVDIQLDTNKLADHGYADLLESLDAAGYEHGTDELKPFQLRRVVDLHDDGPPVAVIVDVLMPKGAKTKKNKPKFVEGFRALEADGGEVALRHNIKLKISGTMPDGRRNAPNFEEGVVDTVMRGGDTDTNAAICGALLGAVHGLNAVPVRWVDRLLNCRPEAGRPDVRHPRPDVFWPVDAMDLATHLVSGRGTVRTATANGARTFK
jgi:hypothetical protein